jgi:hypothetical protein
MDSKVSLPKQLEARSSLLKSRSEAILGGERHVLHGVEKQGVQLEALWSGCLIIATSHLEEGLV